MGREKLLSISISEVQFDFAEIWKAGALWGSTVDIVARMTGGTSGLKWQCSANCRLF